MNKYFVTIVIVLKCCNFLKKNKYYFANTKDLLLINFLMNIQDYKILKSKI